MADEESAAPGERRDRGELGHTDLTPVKSKRPVRADDEADGTGVADGDELTRTALTKVMRRMLRSARRSGALSRPVMEVFPRPRGRHRFLPARKLIRTARPSVIAMKPLCCVVTK